jgi:LAO/AO transport system kinase
MEAAQRLKVKSFEKKRKVISKLISEAEGSVEQARDIVNSILPYTGKAYVIGITGPPGCGKSTLVDRLALQIRKIDKNVGIIATEPSSPSSGGAFMGNRVRMREASCDNRIFIRSMASRGSLNGLALAAFAAIKILDAAGFEYVIIETVGAGQLQTDIAKIANTVVIVLQPESGDIIQTMKAGLMEIGDIFAVNKSDMQGADKTANDLRDMLNMARSNDGWMPRIVKTVATKGIGVTELTRVIKGHRKYLISSREILNKRKAIARHEVEKLLEEEMKKKIAEKLSTIKAQSIIEDIAARKVSPYDAARDLMSEGDRV